MPRPTPLELKRRIGVLPEDLGLFDDLTVEEHLLLTGDIYGVPRQETARARRNCCTRSAWSTGGAPSPPPAPTACARRPRSPWRCCPIPQVLFLDEPFEAIDPVTAKIMRDLLQSVARHGVTVFLTSHILSMVERIAHQIVMIRKGTMVWNSTVGELPQSLEDHYFDLVETPVVEELEWLGPSRS